MQYYHLVVILLEFGQDIELGIKIRKMSNLNKTIKEIRKICNKYELTKRETQLTMKSILLTLEYEKELKWINEGKDNE